MLLVRFLAGFVNQILKRERVFFVQGWFHVKQGGIHDSISRVWVGRGSDPVKIAIWGDFAQHDGRTDLLTNQLTDRQSDL